MYLSEAIDSFIGHSRARGLEPSTIDNLRQPLTRGLEAWGDLPMQDISSHHMDQLFACNQYKPRTQNLYIGALRQFFRWAHHTGIRVGDDPTFGWRARKVEREDRVRIPVERFPDLLDAAGSARDRMVVAIGLYTFMRGSEIQLLRVNSVNFSGGVIHMRRQKTKEDDSMPICLELREELVRWLSFYRQNCGNEDLRPTWFLTPSKGPNTYRKDRATGEYVQVPGERLRPWTQVSHPYEIAKKAMHSIGYPSVKNEGIHTLRRSGARALFDSLKAQGEDQALLIVGSMLGHKDTKVTAHYIGLQVERERRNQRFTGERLFPDMPKTRGLKAI